MHQIRYQDLSAGNPLNRHLKWYPPMILIHAHAQGSYPFRKWFIITAVFIILCTGMASANPYFSPDEGKIPLKVQFTLPGGDSCDSVKWDFGDGNTSTQVNPSFTYTKMGFFYPTCVCTLPGATITYTFGKIVPSNANMADSETANPHYPTATSVDAKSDQLSVEELKKQGTGLYTLGLYDYAASSYKAAVQRSGSDPDILSMYGNILAGLSRWEEAKDVYNQSLAIRPDKGVLNSYGGVLIQLKKNEAALDAFNRSLELDSSNPGAWAGSARAFGSLKKTNESAAAYLKSLDLDASQPLVWKEYGDVLSTLNNDSDAIKAYEKAISLGVSGSDIYYKYGEALRKIGRQKDAEAAMTKARGMQGQLYSSIDDSTPVCTSASGVM